MVPRVVGHIHVLSHNILHPRLFFIIFASLTTHDLFSACFFYLSLLLFLISLHVLFEHIFRISSLFNSIFESIAWMIFVVGLGITICTCELSQSIGIIILYFKWNIKNLFPFRSFALPMEKKNISIHLSQVFPLHTLTQQMLVFLFPPTYMN